MLSFRMLFKRCIISLILFAFIAQFLPTNLLAADIVLPPVGQPVFSSAKSDLIAIKGLKIDPLKPFRFELLLDNSQKIGDGYRLKQQADELVKFFLACLTLPEEDLWVNLSPYEKDRIIPQALGQTDLGRTLLAEDYILKQLSASLMDPRTELGKKFWDRVYTKAQAKLGTTQVPVNTYNKVWILADTARVLNQSNSAYVLDSHLKVMMDTDYLSQQKIRDGALFFDTNQNSKQGSVPNFSDEMYRSIILPEIEKEVNEGGQFAQLRQIYQAFVLATWYKKNLKSSLVNTAYANKAKVDSILSTSNQEPQQIYTQYLNAYKKGAINFINNNESIPRKYFAGGTQLRSTHIIDVDPAQLTDVDKVALTQASYAVVVDLKVATDTAMTTKVTVAQLQQNPVMKFLTKYAQGNKDFSWIFEPIDKSFEPARLIRRDVDLLTEEEVVGELEQSLKAMRFEHVYDFKLPGYVWHVQQALDNPLKQLVLLSWLNETMPGGGLYKTAHRTTWGRTYAQQYRQLYLWARYFQILMKEQTFFTKASSDIDNPSLYYMITEVEPNREKVHYLLGIARLFLEILTGKNYINNDIEMSKASIAKAMNQLPKWRESVRNYLGYLQAIKAQAKKIDDKGHTWQSSLDDKHYQDHRYVELLEKALVLADTAMTSEVNNDQLLFIQQMDSALAKITSNPATLSRKGFIPSEGTLNGIDRIKKMLNDDQEINQALAAVIALAYPNTFADQQVQARIKIEQWNEHNLTPDVTNTEVVFILNKMKVIWPTLADSIDSLLNNPPDVAMSTRKKSIELAIDIQQVMEELSVPKRLAYFFKKDGWVELRGKIAKEHIDRIENMTSALTVKISNVGGIDLTEKEKQLVARNMLNNLVRLKLRGSVLGLRNLWGDQYLLFQQFINAYDQGNNQEATQKAKELLNVLILQLPKEIESEKGKGMFKKMLLKGSVY